jgi:transcription elongation factor Elf1
MKAAERRALRSYIRAKRCPRCNRAGQLDLAGADRQARHSRPCALCGACGWSQYLAVTFKSVPHQQGVNRRTVVADITLER